MNDPSGLAVINALLCGPSRYERECPLPWWWGQGERVAVETYDSLATYCNLRLFREASLTASQIPGFVKP